MRKREERVFTGFEAEKSTHESVKKIAKKMNRTVSYCLRVAEQMFVDKYSKMKKKIK